MKTIPQFLCRPILAVICSLTVLQTTSARAAFNCWDPTGATASATPTGVWEGSNWAPTAALSASPGTWPETGILPVFAAGTGATGTYTVTANSDHTVAGIFDGVVSGTSAGNVTLNGPGILTISPGQQGFSVASTGVLTIYNSLAGTGQMINENSGQLYLYGTNTYSGGTQFGVSSSAFTGTININNNSAFGTGAITLFSSGCAIAVPTGVTNAITLPNPVTTAAVSLNIVGNPAGLTFAGPWTMAATPNIGAGTAGNLVIISGMMSGAGGLNKYNPATLKLTATNTYTGITTVSNGSLALGPNGSINNSAGLVIVPNAAGTIFDVSANPAYTLGSSTTLYAQGTGIATGIAANIKGASGGTVSLGARPVKLIFTPTVFTGDLAHPPLYISQGALALNNNVITVTNAAATALGLGTYRLIQVGNGTSGTTTGTPNGNISVVGTGIATGLVATVSVANGNVNLVVKTPALFTNFSISQSTSPGVGVTNVTVSGRVIAGSFYPAKNETVTVSLNGTNHNTLINDTTGDFSYTFDPRTIPYFATNNVTYIYPGNTSLAAVTNNTPLIDNAFYVGDSASGFISGINFFFTNTSGINMSTWSTANPGLPVTDWTLEGAMGETTLNDNPGKSRYSINVNPATPLVYYICGPTRAWPFLSPTALQSIATDDGGNYTVVPTNTAITAAGVLNLPASPFFVQQPVSQTNLLGKNVSFNAVVTGSGPLNYQWYFNSGTPIGSPSTNSLLSLTNISSGSAGSYSLVVTNLYGGATSTLSTLTVLLPPSIATQMNSNGLALSAQTIPGTTVELQTTTNLVAPAIWANIATNVVDTNGFVQFTNTVVLTNKVRFYRLYFP